MVASSDADCGLAGSTTALAAVLFAPEQGFFHGEGAVLARDFSLSRQDSWGRESDCIGDALF
jgi:hypothetical protein